jgi:hypothetical protein
VNLQILLNEEQAILMKNTLLAVEGDSKTTGKIQMIVTSKLANKLISYYVLYVFGVPPTLISVN